MWRMDACMPFFCFVLTAIKVCQYDDACMPFFCFVLTAIKVCQYDDACMPFFCFVLTAIKVCQYDDACMPCFCFVSYSNHITNHRMWANNKPTLIQGLVFVGTYTVGILLSSRQEVLNQCCFNVGPASQTVAQH